MLGSRPLGDASLMSKQSVERDLRTFDCEPTLSDLDVLAFCQTGFLMLNGIVPEDINKRVVEYYEQEDRPSGGPPIKEQWYLDNVQLNPRLTGVLRSLLGRNFGYFDYVSSHRNVGPQPAQGWHRDGGAVYAAQIDSLQVFYLPQGTAEDMGPTEVVPGSHLLFQMNQYSGHYDGIRGAVKTIAPAGSMFIAVLWTLASPIEIRGDWSAKSSKVVVRSYVATGTGLGTHSRL